MLYTIKGRKIQSKKAARSPSHTNRQLIEFIKSLDRNQLVLDYGCGKLRYSIPLARRVREVVGVDSEAQITSDYFLSGRQTNVKEQAAKHSNLSIYSLDQLAWKKLRYNSIFCVHVLSAIPSFKPRNEIIKNSFDLLKKQGELIIMNTLKDTYYERLALEKTSIQHLDGFISTKSGDPTFFGYVCPRRIEKICIKVGFSNVEIARIGSSYVLIARK